MGRALANLVSVTLRHGDYETKACTSENECRGLIAQWKPHMSLIDIDHHEPLMTLIGREMKDLPMLAFTRKRDTAVKLNAFERGVDDIVEVPFTLDEIVARPYAIMRRRHGVTAKLNPRIKLGNQIEVDLIAQTVKLAGERPL